jgi:L-threonylcarbamoyladenylate synthase
MLRKHYAPKAKLIIRSWRNEAELRGGLANSDNSRAGCQLPLADCHILAHTVVPSGEGFGRVGVMPHDAPAFARAIYAELHQCDEAGAELIVVEAPPETGEWRAIADRLKRAAAC